MFHTFHFQDFVGMCLSARPIVLYYILSELEKERLKPLSYKSPFVQSPNHMEVLHANYLP